MADRPPIEDFDEAAVPVACRHEARFVDGRGETVIVHSGSTADFVEYIEFAHPAAARGSHLHVGYTEKIYLLRGRLTVSLVDMTGDEPHAYPPIELRAGEHLTVHPGIGHRYAALEPSEAVVVGRGSSPLTDRVPVAPEVWDRAGFGPVP